MSIFDSQPIVELTKESADQKSTGSIGHFSELSVGAGEECIVLNKEGAKFGARVFDDAPAFIKTDGTFKFKNSSGTTIIDSLGSSGNFIEVINSKLDTSTKRILSDFNFGTSDYSGAVKAGDITWNTTTGALTGGTGVVLNRKGIIGAASGVAKFTLDATTGDATFAGTLSAAGGTLGTITSGTIQGATIKSSTGNGRIEITNGDRLYFYDGAGNIQGTCYGDADDLRIYAADDVHIGAGNAAVIKVGQSHISPISTDMTYDIGDSSHYFDRVYAHAYSTEAGLGSDTDFSVITSMDDQTDGTYVTNVRYKTRALTLSGGIIIGVGTESDWIDS